MEAALAKAGRHLDWREMGPDLDARDVAAEPSLWGDAMLSRKDIPASYHIAVVVDDALQGVTDVVRGEDLFMATGLHRLLQILLDLPAPSYRHHAAFARCIGPEIVEKFEGQVNPGAAQGGTFSGRGARQAFARSDLRRRAMIVMTVNFTQ